MHDAWREFTVGKTENGWMASPVIRPMMEYKDIHDCLVAISWQELSNLIADKLKDEPKEG